MTAAINGNAFALGAGEGGPRRPSLADLGGATVQNGFPEPDRSRMVYGEQQNSIQHHAYAACRVADLVTFSIKFTTGTPSMDGVLAPNPAIGIPTFTVTDNGTGDTTITWAAGTFPPITCQPQVTVNSLGDFRIAARKVTNGVRIQTFAGGAGTAADAEFTVTLK